MVLVGGDARRVLCWKKSGRVGRMSNVHACMLALQTCGENEWARIAQIARLPGTGRHACSHAWSSSGEDLIHALGLQPCCHTPLPIPHVTTIVLTGVSPMKSGSSKSINRRDVIICSPLLVPVYDHVNQGTRAVDPPHTQGSEQPGS